MLNDVKPVAMLSLAGYAETKVCAAMSGGNLDSSMLATILGAGVPA
jgi:hypothetical protein